MASLNSLTDIMRFSATLPPDQGDAVRVKVLDLVQHLQSYDFSGRLDMAGFSRNSHQRLYRRLKDASAGMGAARKPKRKPKSAEA